MVNVSLTKDEFDFIRNTIESRYYDYTDHNTEDELKNNEDYQFLCKLDKKLIKTYNKQTGRYYLWQLKDPDLSVTDDNLRDEWK